MAKVNFKRIPDSGLIDNVPIEDGSIIITRDGKTYVDFENNRIPVCGTPDDTMSDKSTNTVQNNTIKEYVDSNNKKLSDELRYNLVPNADPVKTGRKINNKDEYVKRIETTLNNSTQIGSNRRYEIETGLSNVKFTKPVSGFIKSSDSQLDINMVRFDGSTLSNVSHSAYLNENNCKIIFETAGYNRDGLTITADLYFIYQNEQTVEES